MEENNYQRNTAVKIDIMSLRQGEFIENENNMQPNYINTIFGDAYRVNIIGIVIAKDNEFSTAIIDDGTGPITLQFNFYNRSLVSGFQSMKEGDVVVTIGRPRKYDDKVYIDPEIINILDDKAWLSLRKEEIRRQKEEGFSIGNITDNKSEEKENKYNDETDYKNEDQTTQQETKENDEEMKDVYSIVYEIITKNDEGDGVDSDKIEREMQKMNIEDAKKVIVKLLENGDIFEISPGRVKIL